MRSLKRFLTIRLALALGVLMSLQWMVVTYALDHLVEDQLVERLKQEGNSLLAVIDVNVDGGLSLVNLPVKSIYLRPFSGRYFAIRTANQSAQSRSLWDHTLNLPLLPTGRVEHRIIEGPLKQRLMMVLHGYSKQGVNITVAVAEDISGLQEDKWRFFYLFSFLSSIGLLLLLWSQTRIVTQGLRPLSAIRRRLIQLRRGELAKIMVSAPEEVEPLIDELNRLLENISQRSRRSRQATGNLAHALKTRLTLLNQIAERRELDGAVSLRQDILKTTQDLRVIVERELRHARLLGTALPGKAVDIAEELPQLIQTLEQIYRDKALTFSVHIDADARFLGDSEDFLELIGNVLDNACKWCQQRVDVKVQQSEDTLIMIINDDGPGCSEEDLQEIDRRGYRADENTPGSGLGLAIVRDTVDAYGGKLRFASGEGLGGLHVTIRFPSDWQAGM